MLHELFYNIKVKRLSAAKRTQVQFRSKLRLFFNDWRQEHYDRCWIGVISGIVIVSRWWGRSTYLFASDSGLYALALEKYDLSLQQPHPPGYPLYILLAKVLSWFIPDANTAFVLISIGFSVLALWAVFSLAKIVYDRRTAWISLALWVVAPMLWFHGQVAMNYMADAFFSAIVGHYIYHSVVNQHDVRLARRSLLLASISLAIGGGFRPTLVVFLLPVWLWALWQRRNWREQIMHVSWLVAIVTAWVLPQIWLSGGWQKFFPAMSSMFLSKSGIYSFSVFAAGLGKAWHRMGLIWHNLLLNFGISALAAIIYLFTWLVPEQQEFKISPRVWLWNLWIWPVTLFYILIIFNMPGYLLVVLPAITILVAQAIIRLGTILAQAYRPPTGQSRQLIPTILTMFVVLAMSWNVWTYWKPDAKIEMQKNTHQSIKSSNDLWASLNVAVREKFNPQNTIIGLQDSFVLWGLPQFAYYFPEYPVYIRLFWGIANPDDKKWILAYRHHIQLVDQLEIVPTDTNLIVIRGNWNQPEAQYRQVDLEGIGSMAYYDLTDTSIRALLSQLPYIKVNNWSQNNNDQP
ncbi:MAG: hypothetical protein VE97_C0011G0005 [candidate division Kazan bacterium GW2011_GWB1_45_10]|uniref:Glycosyltransferase RgtA/B/C/D-like domain-containing protein n=1 Tax=candidate division Kazan bacterium GW2011_GWB1_45_10 TaxID=1620411 RepID=A0A0G1NRT1_UNCK3|nr:MAG: hypothetical protein VE97_C0011G0005 [candidate division Kazan bacterium GW2011_GWB1_45_10]